MKILKWLKKCIRRKITLARKSTFLYILYGKLGRFSIEVTIKSRMIGYWNKLIQSKGTNSSFLVYQCLIHTTNVPSKWIMHIQSIFYQIGRPDI